MSVWPASLPAPAISSFSFAPADNAIRSNMDKGPAKVRRRTTANVRPESFTLKMTKTQAQTLYDFYVDDLYSGSDTFTFPDSFNDEILTARFKQAPTITEQEGIVWMASIELEIMP